ncbi:MAG TPA: hypothetical protein VGL38_05000 [bacterium]
MTAVLVCGDIQLTTPAEEQLVDNGQCTTAVIAGFATANGRPLLWKNRDVSQPDQEIVYFNDGTYPYVTIANAHDNTQAWGGVNSVGFAIEDANNWNTQDTVPGSDDDGTIIKLALRTCATVNQFQTILDSTRIHGHTQPAIFGVIDAEGGASMFETFAHSYIRYDCNDTSDTRTGVLVRSNFSYAGTQTGRIGVYRHNRAQTFIENAVAGDSLTAKFICRTVARDLHNENGLNPYPLPYQGTSGGLPRGWISTYGAVCRRLSVSACVIEGVQTNEDPMLSTLWAFPMAVQYGVALPFWVASRTTPPEVNGDSTAPLCDVGLRIKTLAQHQPGFHDTLDTYMLVDGHGGGVLAATYPLEDRIFQRADSALAVWRTAGHPDSAGMTTLSAQLATMAYDSLHDWPRPGQLWVQPRAVAGLTAYNVPDVGLRFRWDAVTQDTLGFPISPAGYTLWRSDANTGHLDSITTTTATQVVIPVPTDSTRGTYVVKARR